MNVKLIIAGLAIAFFATSPVVHADLIGDTYYISPVLRSNGSTAFAGASTLAVFDLSPNTIGTGFGGGNLVINETFTDNGNGTSTIELIVDTSANGEMFPTGQFGNNPTTAGIVLGTGQSTNGLDFDSGTVILLANGASATFRNSLNAIIGSPINVYSQIGSGNGVWDGRFSLDFGGSFVGAGVATTTLSLTFIPEPSSLVILSLIGLGGLCTRRRR